jgi:hypothetical protein
MKFLSFIKWHIRKLTLDMFLWAVFCFCVSASYSSTDKTYLYIAQALFLYGFSKFSWYMIRESYEKFQKEQQQLFETIKNSDSK